MGITWVVVAGAFLLGSFVKGTTGMGFPLIATPMVALLVDIKTTYAILVVPNILMDVWQLSRGRLPWLLWRRLSWLLFTTAVGAWLGTRILISVPERFIYLALAAMILIFLVAKLSQLAAISRWGLYTGEILRWSAGLTAIALVAFWVGLRVQDRVPQATFARILHGLLLGMELFFIYRGL